jgi:CRP/FNR family transcriptional regulator, anaerobic regulatory protein
MYSRDSGYSAGAVVQVIRQAKAQAASAFHLGEPCADCEIREIGVCSSLNPGELEQVRRIVSTLTLHAGQAAIVEGEPAQDLFNVITGAVKLYKLLPDGRRQITGFLSAGDFLGIAYNDTYAYTAEAVTDVKLCRFPRQRLEALLPEHPALERRLLGEAAHELVAAQDQMLLLGRKTAMERVASFLLMQAKRASRMRKSESRLDVPMTRTDIGDYLGLTTETVSRAISRMRDDKIVAVETRGQITILDRQALERLTEGE